MRSGGWPWTLRSESLYEMSSKKASASADMSGDGREELGILASITAAIETTRIDLTDITIQTGDETCHGRIQLQLPLPDVDGLAATHVEINDVQLSNGELQFDLDIEIDDSTSTADVDPHVLTPDTTDTTSKLETSTRCVTASDQSPNQQIGSNSETHTSERTQSSVQHEQTQQSFSENGTTIVAEPHSEDDRPKYQQPPALAEVYDENATFEEMRAELGVDVTAQTVRKYMIKYGIHTPQPRTDRLLESIRASDPELTSTVVEDNRDRGLSDNPDSNG